MLDVLRSTRRRLWPRVLIIENRAWRRNAARTRFSRRRMFSGHGRADVTVGLANAKSHHRKLSTWEQRSINRQLVMTTCPSITRNSNTWQERLNTNDSLRQRWPLLTANDDDDHCDNNNYNATTERSGAFSCHKRMNERTYGQTDSHSQNVLHRPPHYGMWYYGIVYDEALSLVACVDVSEKPTLSRWHVLTHRAAVSNSGNGSREEVPAGTNQRN